MRKWNVFVLDHVRYALSHGEKEEGEEVDDQHGPEHRHIEYGEQRQQQTDDQRLECRVPELEFGQSAHERSELVR